MIARNKKAWQKVTISLLTATLVGGLTESLWLSNAYADVSGSTPIRVGLMINSSSVNTTTDTVTLQGRSGLKVGFYSGGSFAPVYSVSGAVKASLDNYYILVGEYDTLNSAQSMADQLDNMGLSYDIFVQNRAGKKVYQVVNGYYEMHTQAAAALAKIQANFGSGTILGYYRLTTGTVSGLDAAVAKANSLRQAGFDAYPLVRKNGSCEVWIGDAGSSGDLSALQQQIQSKLGVTYSKADYSAADYMVIKTSVYGGQEIPFTVQDSDTEEVAFVPSSSPAVTKVMEKGNREYRGSILVQGYHGKPNVIDYVPLDQYLYGVVPQEMATGWPMEALKAQAVAARTYAAKLIGSDKWGVADITDDVYDQAYRGYSKESDDTTAAVDATKGQVLLENGSYIDALYSSDHGGYSGDAREMWGSTVDYLPAVDSSYDKVAADREPLYYRVQLPNGMIGWMRADSVAVSGTNNAGFQTGSVQVDGQPVRYTPDLYAKVMENATQGDRVVILGQEKEYNEYNWQRGPYSPTDIMNMIDNNQANGYATVGSPVYDLEVTKWGGGQRAMMITADGTDLTVPNPDYYRALFNDMWSTKVTIEQQGTYTVQSASGKSSYPNAKLNGQPLYAVSASGAAPTSAINGSNGSFVLLGANSQNRVVSKDQSYIIHGYGFGHGLGLSQWGANGMAQAGYTYDQILAHYYKGVTLTPKQ